MKLTQRISLPKKQISIKARSKFVRSIITSLFSTLMDFSSSLIFVSVGLFYVTATTLGGVLGAIVSFYLSRIWVFEKMTGKISLQLSKFIFTNIFSIILNTSGVFFVMESFNVDFLYARILVAVFIGVFFNYFLYQYFVFRK